MKINIRFLTEYKLPQGHGGLDCPQLTLNSGPSNAAGLDELARQAKSYALHMMRSTGSVPPAMIAATADGFIFCKPAGMPDEAARDQFADLARSLVIAHNARAIVMVAEAWVMPTLPALPSGSVARPSPVPDPQEMVVLMLEDRAYSVTGLLPILRESSGVFCEFGQGQALNFTAVSGCCTGLMPRHVPGAGEVAKARAELLRLGRCVLRRGVDPAMN